MSYIMFYLDTYSKSFVSWKRLFAVKGNITKTLSLQLSPHTPFPLFYWELRNAWRTWSRRCRKTQSLPPKPAVLSYRNNRGKWQAGEKDKEISNSINLMRSFLISPQPSSISAKWPSLEIEWLRFSVWELLLLHSWPDFRRLNLRRAELFPKLKPACRWQLSSSENQGPGRAATHPGLAGWYRAGGNQPFLQLTKQSSSGSTVHWNDPCSGPFCPAQAVAGDGFRSGEAAVGIALAQGFPAPGMVIFSSL